MSFVVFCSVVFFRSPGTYAAREFAVLFTVKGGFFPLFFFLSPAQWYYLVRLWLSEAGFPWAFRNSTRFFYLFFSATLPNIFRLFEILPGTTTGRTRRTQIRRPPDATIGCGNAGRKTVLDHRPMRGCAETIRARASSDVF